MRTGHVDGNLETILDFDSDEDQQGGKYGTTPVDTRIGWGKDKRQKTLDRGLVKGGPWWRTSTGGVPSVPRVVGGGEVLSYTRVWSIVSGREVR